MNDIAHIDVWMYTHTTNTIPLSNRSTNVTNWLTIVFSTTSHNKCLPWEKDLSDDRSEGNKGKHVN